jgi:integrase
MKRKKKPNGIRWREDRKRWEYRKYYHGTTYSGLCRTEDAARDALAKIARHIDSLKNIPPNALTTVINEFLLWSKEVGKSSERIKALIKNFSTFIVTFYGADTPISEITKTDVERFIAAQKKRTVKNSTIWHYCVDLAALFNYYIETLSVPIVNPVKKADKRAIKNRKVVKPPFDPTSVDRAIAALSGPDDVSDRLYVMVAACTGARRGEINRTRWSDLFLSDPEKSWYKIPGTKTEESLSLHPIPAVLAVELIAWRDRNMSDLVLPGRNNHTKGKEVRRREATFRKIYRLTGVKLTSKDLRDYYASMVNTTDPRILKDLMRHTSLSTTTTYSRRREELMRAAVENLGSNFGENETALPGAKIHETTFFGNQYTSRKEWLSKRNIMENIGGGGRSRTADAADMSRVDDTKTPNEMN